MEEEFEDDDDGSMIVGGRGSDSVESEVANKIDNRKSSDCNSKVV